MAQVASKCLFFFLFLLLLNVCSSGTVVGLSYHAEENTATSSLGRYASLFKMSNVSESEAVHTVLSRVSNSGAFVDLSLNESLVESLSNPASLASLWVKTQLVTSLPRVNIRSITVGGNNDLPRVLLTMKSIHSILLNLHVDNGVKVSVAFPVSFLENLSTTQEKYLHRILELIKRTSSFVFVEASVDVDGKSGLENPSFITSMIQRAAVATSSVSCNDVPVVMRLKSLVVRSELELAELENRVLGSMENSKFAEIYVEVPYRESFVEDEHEEEIFHSSRRELSNEFKTTVHDGTNPPATLFPTNPGTMPPVTLPPDTPTPTIVTVPATNPVTITPNNPGSTPIPLPTTTPVTVPPVNPSVNPPVPVSNPVTTPAPITVPGAQPVTNPVTTYPAPTGNVPGTAPITNPVPAPPNTNAPAVPGQSWCVAKSGSSETALQTALDYACGVGGADCSQIQQSGSCYNPNTIQNHASYAFNSYYQKNPGASSCDFGGTANLVNANPSTGSCIYSSSSSSSSTTSLPTPSTPPTPPTNPATTPSSPAAGISSNPPSLLNQSNPASTYGSEIPPADSTSASNSAALHPFVGTIILLAGFII